MATTTESEVVLQIGETAGAIWRVLAAKGLPTLDDAGQLPLFH